jgi:hypothetical protein
MPTSVSHRGNNGEGVVVRSKTEPIGLPGARASLVAAFLQEILANGPVAVAEIEGKARDACLLGAHQEVSGAKLFKRAKKILGIKSRRVGFGAAGDWLWELPAPACLTPPQPAGLQSIKEQPAGAIYVEDRSDPEQITESSGDVWFPPRQPPKVGGISKMLGVAEWTDGVASLDSNRAPAGIPPHRWRQFIDDCKAFLEPVEGLAERALQRDWNTLDLFACHPTQPLAHLAVAGLMWVVNGGRVVELHSGWAVIEYPAIGTQRNFNQRRPQQTNLTLPWWLRR